MEQITLSDTKSGKKYYILSIRDEARLVNRLSSMGLMNGSQIEICQNQKKQPVLIFARDNCYLYINCQSLSTTYHSQTFECATPKGARDFRL